MVLITIVNGVYKPTYGHLEGKLIYHWVDFPLPCLITGTRKNMVLLLNNNWFLTKPKTKHVSLQSN
jgi:hypothetical protein